MQESLAVCGDDTPVWRLDYDGLFPIHVGAAGPMRVDYLDAVLLGTDAEHWLACVATCPGTEVTDVCVPFRLPVALGFAVDASCELEETEAPAWNGRAARRLGAACGEPGEPVGELVYVPELRGARDALVRASVIDSRSPLARLDGLVVDIATRGRPVMTLRSIATSSCDALGIPDGYRVIGGVDAYAELDDLAERYRLEAEAARAEVGDRFAAHVRRDVLRRHRDEIAERCAIAGTPLGVEKNLERCLAAHPEITEWITGLLAARLEEAATDVQQKMELVLRAAYLGPICRHYATAARSE